MSEGESGIVEMEKQFGESFQGDLVLALIEFNNYSKGWISCLKAEYFSEPWSTIFNIINSFYQKGGTIPTKEYILATIKEELTADGIGDMSGNEIIKAIEKNIEPRNLPYIKEHLQEFCKFKAYQKIYSEEGLTALGNKDYDTLDNLYSEARQAGIEKDFETDELFDDIEKLYEESTNIHFTTGIPPIDNVIDEGGPTTGDVVGFLAPTGVGKSWALINVGVANMLKGHNVLHITLEMPRQQIRRRYNTNLTGIPSTILSPKYGLKDRAITELVKRMKELQIKKLGKLVIADATPNITSIATIRTIIDNAELEHKCKFQVLIIDYLEKLGSIHKEKNKADEYQRQGCVAVELFELTKSMNLCTFTATQTNREGYKEKSKGINLGHAAGSYDKTTPMGYWLTMTRNEEEHIDYVNEINNYKEIVYQSTIASKKCSPISEFEFNKFFQMEWKIIKNRNGTEGTDFITKLNTLTGEIGWLDHNQTFCRRGK